MKTFCIALLGLSMLCLAASAGQVLKGIATTGDREEPTQQPNSHGRLDTGGETCETAAIIGALPFTDSGNTQISINNYNWNCFLAGSGGKDVVYQYVPTTDQRVNFSLCGSGFDTKMYIYDGACSGTPIACNDDAFPCPGSETNFRSYLEGVALRSGHTYYIIVDGWSSADYGPYVFQAAAYTGPTRVCSQVTPADASLAFTSAPCSGTVSGNCGNGGKWVGEFNAVTGTEYHFDLCSNLPCAAAANFDADIKICDGFNSVREGQDGRCSEAGGESFRPNNFIWTPVANGIYYVVIAPFSSSLYHACNGSADSTFTLLYWSASNPVPPFNDDCDGAEHLTVNATDSTCGTTVGATLDCSRDTYAEVWYTFTTTERMNIIVRHCGTFGYGVSGGVILYSGSCCGTYLPEDRFDDASCFRDEHFALTAYYDNLAAGQYWFPCTGWPGRQVCVRVAGTPAESAPEPGTVNATEFALHPNYPNPFNPTTTIAYNLPRESHVRLSVINVHGQEIAVLLHDEQQAGLHTISWNAAAQPTGMYLAVLDAGDQRFMQKMLLIK